MIRRGEVRWFRFARPDKRRPVVVLGRDEVLATWSLVPVVPLSTQVRGLAWEVGLGTADGLPSNCVAKPEWIRAVASADLGPVIATLQPERMGELREAILLALGFER